MAERASDWQWSPAIGASDSSHYCNNVQVMISVWDFNFEFSQIVPVPTQPNAPPELTQGQPERIVMSPQHAKAFLKVLRQNVEQWEEQFGELPDVPLQ